MNWFRLACLLVLTACGVTAGNPTGGGGRRTTYLVAGTIQTLESPVRAAMNVQVFDAYGKAVTYTTSATDGTYAVAVSAEGQYELQFGPAYRQQVAVIGDTLLNVLLPLPAAPGNLRFVDIGPRDFCLLWKDNSGLEAGFVIEGPRGYEAPANRIGLREYFINYPYGDDGLPDYVEAARRWNAAFVGTWHIHGWNEYGVTVSTSTDVSPYPEDKWTSAEPPVEPPERLPPDAERALCLSVERNAGKPVFVLP